MWANLCSGAMKNMSAVILGRAISGIGGAGIMAISSMIITGMAYQVSVDSQRNNDILVH